MVRRLFVFVVAGMLAGLAGCGPATVPPASVGILFDGSTGIRHQILQPRVQWLSLYQRLIVYPTSIKNATYVRNAKEGEEEGDNSIQAITREGVVLPMDVTLAYYVQPADAVQAFTEFGSEDIEALQRDYFRWVVNYGVNAVSGRHRVFDLISKDRANVGPEIKAVVAPLLADWGITVDSVYVGEIYPGPEINAKIAESIGARNDLAKARIEVQRATVDAGTILTNAGKVAEQNRLMGSQGGLAVRLRRMELKKLAAEKWDGVPPLVGDGKIPFSGMEP